MTESRTTGDSADDERLDEIVAECLERSSSGLRDAVESACAAHPGDASAIRRRIEKLRLLGLVQDSDRAQHAEFPERLGDFQLIERLGGGGMGVVFRARQISLGREVALKLIRPEHLYFARARERFRRETEAVARLHHVGIVPIYSVGEERGVPYFAMELIGGATLAEILRELEGLAPERLRGADLARALKRKCAPDGDWEHTHAASAFDDGWVECAVRSTALVADALHHAHERGVLHRDVKPSNLALTPDGRALLFDFGLASLGDDAPRITSTRSELGSLHYMAPEQLRDARGAVDRRADVYSLGVTLYEWLALQVPFAESAALDTRSAILEGRASPLRARNRAVPRELEIVCATAMEPDLTRRYPDAAAFARDLRNVLEHRPIEARAPNAVTQLRRWVQRHPVATVAIAACIATPMALYVEQERHAKELTLALEEARTQRAAADAQARDARWMSDFLREVFSSVDPSAAKGSTVTARDLLDSAAKKLDTTLLDQPLVRARLLDVIGESYTSLDEFELAESALNRALELREANAGAESLEMASSLASLSVLERMLGQPDALEHAKRALDLRRKLSTKPELEWVDAAIDYGMCLQQANRGGEAEVAYREALSIGEQLDGDRREVRASVLSNLATLHLDASKYAEAIQEGREAVALLRALGPAPHPGVTACLNTVAIATSSIGQFDEARATFVDLLATEQRITGDESTRYAIFLAAEGNCELTAERADAAIELLERAARIFARAAPPSYAEAVKCREVLVRAYQQAGRWEDALNQTVELERLLAPLQGAPRQRIRRNVVMRALCDEALGRADDALTHFHSALENARADSAPADDVWVLGAISGAARMRLRRGDLEGALEEVARVDRDPSADSPSVRDLYWMRFARAEFAEFEGDLDAARGEYAGILAIGGHWRYGTTVPAIAAARLALIDDELAPGRGESALEEALAELECRVGPFHAESWRFRAELHGRRHATAR